MAALPLWPVLISMTRRLGFSLTMHQTLFHTSYFGENRCKSASNDLNKRTQFLPSNTTLTSFITTTYIQSLCPALNRTNPISPTSLPVSRPSKTLTTASCLRPKASCGLTPVLLLSPALLVISVFLLSAASPAPLLTPDSCLLTPVFRKTNPIKPNFTPSRCAPYPLFARILTHCTHAAIAQ